MLLHRAAHPLHLILQLPLRAMERVMQRELEILEAFVLMRRAVDGDLALAGQAQKDLDLVGIADMPMAARRLDRHAAGGDAAEALLKTRQLKRYFSRKSGEASMPWNSICGALSICFLSSRVCSWLSWRLCQI